VVVVAVTSDGAGADVTLNATVLLVPVLVVTLRF